MHVPEKRRIIKIVFDDNTEIVLDSASCTVVDNSVMVDDIREYANMGIVKGKKLERKEFVITVSGFEFIK